MKPLFDTLAKKQKSRRPFSLSEDFRYFMENREKLGSFRRFSSFYDSEENEFDILRANILLKGLENKKTLEDEVININNHGSLEHSAFVAALKERTIDLPYHEVNGIKIFIPFFSVALNQIYTNEPEKLLVKPYKNLYTTFEDAAIDPFDTYGAELYNSYFSSLVKVLEGTHVTAFFHYDMNTIYFVNDQGRLDNKIVLFDSYIKRPVFTHMMERITPVCQAYFENDREKTIKSLKDNNLISPQMYKMLKK